MTEEKKTTTTRKPATAKTIAEALAAFQADLPTVSLDGDNPHFKSKFTTLGNLSTTVIPKLSEHGLSYAATPRVTEDGRYVMEAHLLHTSGERLTAQFPITETTPQKIGSALTYARRYLLSALTGVVADQDDDGNAASAPAPKPLEGARQKAAAKPNAAPQGEAEKLKAQIRTWIGGDESKRAQAIEATEKFKAEGKAGVDLQKAIIEELGA